LAWDSLGVTPEKLVSGDVPSWTLAVLEDLKPKLDTIQMGRLRWVLRTAMPLASDFHLFLNKAEVVSSKTDIESIIKFDVTELPKARIASLSKATNETWTAANGRLNGASFPSGITGTVVVTKQSLHAGKSTDLGRSHGFFIRVRGRLVNEEEPLFGLS